MNDTRVEQYALPLAVDATLHYFALFHYPLLAEEVHRFCGVSCMPDEVAEYLEEQVALGRAFRYKNHFSTEQPVREMVTRRVAGNGRAVREIIRAKRVARLISKAPFVRFVGITGSLSKGYADERSDFDFFIVTAGNRLWLCRTLLHLLKKGTFLVGQQHKFCMNYFVDEQALCLEEQNIYTATELATMIPGSHPQQYQLLMERNSWVKPLLPNCKRQEPPAGERTTLLKSAVEWLLNHCAPEACNRLLMRLTDARWRRKWHHRQYPAADYALAFKTTLHISKNHPANYQKKILTQLKAKQAS